MLRRICAFMMAFGLLILPVFGESPEEETTAETEAEEVYTEIYTLGDLLGLTRDPTGHFRLMEDLDMTDFSWPCPSFSGVFDGNGHSLLNLTITEVGPDRAEVLDGNQKPYEAAFAGFFGKLDRAEIRDLHLVNVKLLVQTDEPCMAGGIAGYSMDSTITGCSVTGRLELRAHEGMFGLAGILGYGVAAIDHCQADTTLICVDTDPETSDEQFLGGVFGTGFVSVENTEVWLKAYISEHGFVHSGGIGGMLLQYPIGMGRFASLQDNWVCGNINFFEDSPSRRAYCKAIIGEVVRNMNYNYKIAGNTYDDFESEEVKSYDQELRPEVCENPEYAETVVPGDCTQFGYTQYFCKSCGYIYRDRYTLHTHTVTSWTVVTPATTTQEGESEGFCDSCGARQTRVDPILPEPTELETTAPPTTRPPETTRPEPTQPETTLPPVTEDTQVQPERKGFPVWAMWLCGILGAAALGAVIFVITEPKGQHLRKR